MSTELLASVAVWDSEFFGRRIARATGNRLTPESAVALRTWCRGERIECLYFLADAEDAQTVCVAERHGFHLTDLRLTFERGLEAASSDRPDGTAVVRAWQPKDLPCLADIARTAYRHTRFYHDKHFSSDDCGRLYATWIEKSCKGHADEVLVAETRGKVMGYVSCHCSDGGVGQIGLMGLRADVVGEGHGKRLLTSALDWMQSKGAQRVTVVTQGRNVKAQRLYQRCGFITKSVELWYHLWLDGTVSQEQA